MRRRAWAKLLLLVPLAAAGGPQGHTPKPRYALDPDANRVIRRDASGKVRWAAKLDGYLGRVRPPHLVWDAERAYVTHAHGVTALDAKTGKVVWHARGPEDRMCLSGDTLVAADGPRLAARAAATGATLFDITLPARGLDPLPIEEVAGLFLVQRWDDPGGRGDAFLLDRKGKVRHRLDRQVVAGLRRGHDYLLLTSRDVVRLCPDGGTGWAVPLKPQWIAGGGLVEVPGGDLVAFLYGGISDSGVQLARVRPATGKVVWRAYCKGLGVPHSEYYHRATVAVEGNKLRVTSRGSAGTFVEVLDLRSGRRLQRKRLPREEAQ
jgi:hypothetical protein